MKKIISFGLAILLIFSQAAFAAESDKMAEALKLVKERLSVSSSFDDFSSSSYEDELSTVYSFVWTNSNTNESLEVSCNTDGIITSYYNYVPEYSGNSKPAFSDSLYEKAEATAKEFVKKVNPDIYDKVKFSEKENMASTFNHSFSFDFYITENGHKVLINNGYISVNSSAERVTSFHMNYVDKADFSAPVGILSRDEAIKNYAEKLGLKLVYKMYKDDKAIKIYPAYIEKDTSGKYIDAFTGELFTPPADDASPLYNQKSAAGGSMAVTEEAAMDRASFSEIELEELDNVAGLISKEDAEKIVRENKIINLDSKLTLNSINLSKDYYEEEKYVYSLVFRNPEEISESVLRKLTTLRVAIDAKTGKISSFNKYYVNTKEYTDEDEKISELKAKEIADNTLSALGTERKADFKLSSDSENDPYYVTYTREVNGIPFISNTANINIDPYSGEVISWSVSDYDVEFPSLDNVISTDDAIKVLFEQVEYEPVYLVSYKSAEKTYSSALVYYITDNYSININAVTGKLANYKGEDIAISDKAVTYTDLGEHYAKEEIEKLAEYGIAIAGKTTFNPDSAISQKELLAYMLMTFEGEKNITLETNEDVQYIYRRALRLGLINDSEKAPDNPVTRGTAAKIIIRALGYSEVAELTGIYNSPFTDGSDISGYLALIYGMNIAKGDGSGYFYPYISITKAETAMMIYNYLSR